jgi:HSP20 family molecular chaperone IbpA
MEWDMSSQQDLRVQKKREVESETTMPLRVFLPATDIYETPESLIVNLEMPGVDKDRVHIQVEDGTLQVEGQLDFARYEGLQPLYTEYNIGHFSRNFRLPNQIDQGKIEATMKDGVLSIALPKVEQAKPRKISIK